jgi:oligopeptide/dipeptide ABC transporter ATP-binding protein
MTAVLDVHGLCVSYGDVVGAKDVRLRMEPEQMLAVIGETGSGKSSTALGIARLLPPYATVAGKVVIAGRETASMSSREFRHLRGPMVGYIAQDAMASLNPVVRVGAHIEEIFRVHRGASKREAAALVERLLHRVLIEDPRAVMRLYPHQLSGGMRQRVVIAMALALDPPLVIADEPTTALDVITQAEILRLVAQMRSEFGTAVLWVTHDMGLVAELADQVVVMYAGSVVEHGSVHEIFDAPQHPYTYELLATLKSLRADVGDERLYQVDGQPAHPSELLAGCPFHPRCRHASALCVRQRPDPPQPDGRRAACHHPLGLPLAGAS